MTREQANEVISDALLLWMRDCPEVETVDRRPGLLSHRQLLSLIGALRAALTVDRRRMGGTRHAG